MHKCAHLPVSSTEVDCFTLTCRGVVVGGETSKEEEEIQPLGVPAMPCRPPGESQRPAWNLQSATRRTERMNYEGFLSKQNQSVIGPCGPCLVTGAFLSPRSGLGRGMSACLQHMAHSRCLKGPAWGRDDGTFSLSSRSP